MSDPGHPSKLSVVQPPIKRVFGRAAFDSRYNETLVAPENIPGNITPASQAAPTQVDFKLPPGVFNPAKLQLTGEYAYNAANGAGAATPNWMLNVPKIDQLIFTTTSGVFACNHTNFTLQRTQIEMLRAKKMSEFQHMVIGDGANPTRSLKTGRAAILPIDPNSLTAASDIDYLAPQRLIEWIGTGTYTEQLNYRLGDVLPESIFNLNQNMHFEDQVIVRVYFPPENKFLFTSTNIDDPYTGSALQGSAAGGLISNLRLKVYYEQDEDCIKEARSEWKNMELPIPWPSCQRFSVTAAQSQYSQPYTFNSGHGSELRRLTFSLFDGRSDNLVFAGDNCNINESVVVGGVSRNKLASFQVQVNSKNLTNNAINCLGPGNPAVAGLNDNGGGTFTDFNYNRKLAGESPLFQSRATYQSCWHHTDDFTNILPLGEPTGHLQREMFIGGLPLKTTSGSLQQTWQVNLNLTGTQPLLYIYLFWVTTMILRQKDGILTVTPS
jgi:hypothetical protein